MSLSQRQAAKYGKGVLKLKGEIHMSSLIHSEKFRNIWTIAVLLVLLGVSCKPSKVTPNTMPVIQTVEVTRELIREVTREVTRIIEFPVTVTPTLTPNYTATPSMTATITPTLEPPIVTVLAQANCRYGPGSAYLYKYSLDEAWQMEVVGRNLDGSWLYVQGIHGWNPCWVKAELVRVDTGSIADVRITYSSVNYSTLYGPPQSVGAHRSGNEVRIFWEPVWMTEDDYRGYLIEAWVCQGGQQVFLPIGYVTSFDQNSSTLEVKVIDEAGCLQPSSARVYTAEKHGYAGYRVVPWPAFESLPASTTTQTPTNSNTLTKP
jgi:hypothetical protein